MRRPGGFPPAATPMWNGQTPTRRRTANPRPALRASELGDRFVESRGKYRRLAWSVGYVGFLLYVGVITTYAVQVGDIAVALALVGALTNSKGMRFPPPLALFTALLGWVALGYLQTRYPGVVREELVNLAKLGLILFTAVNALRTRAQIRFFIIFWLGCYALYPVRGTYFNYFIGGYSTFGRAIWNYIYANPNDLAALTLLQLSMAAGLLVTEPKGWTKKASLIGVGMLVLLIFMTQSRGGFLGLAVFGLFALAGNRKKGQGLALAAVVAFVVAMFAPESVWDRLGGLTKATDTENLSAVDEEGSAEQRWEIWQTSFEIIADHPGFGVGWGAYPRANAAYAPLGGGGEVQLGARDTHSTYLNVMAESGVPGLLLFVSLVFGTTIWVDGVRRKHRTAFPQTAQQLYFLELGLLGFMVSGIFGSYSRLSFLYLHIVLMYVLAKALQADHRALHRRSAPGGTLTPAAGR